MRIKLTAQFVAILIATSFSGCSKEDEVTPKKLAGTWDTEYYKETRYDAEGKPVSSRTIPVGRSDGQSQEFTTDGKFKYFVSFRLQDQGTYTLDGDNLTLKIVTGSYPGTQTAKIVTLTDTELVEAFDERKGKEGIISELHAKKR